jgi:hypothetical protein
MSRSFFSARLHQVFGALTPGGRRQEPRRRMRRLPEMESLEGRALLANITPTATISSQPAGADFNYTITLTNSSSSASAIGTFWYAWNTTTSNPNINYLATSPISVTPPSGWSDSITNSGPTDGFGILYTANSSASYLAPGSSLVFSFTSADTPAAINGNSVFYPSIPVNTSFVYPQGPFSDSGHKFVVTPTSPTSTPTPTPPAPTPTPTPPAPTPTPISSPTPAPTPTPPVTVTGVQIIQKKHKVTAITVDFSGAVNASEATNIATYVLTMAGNRGSFAVRSAKNIRLRSAVYDAADNVVTLTPKQPFALTKPVEVEVKGQPPGGLQDASGRFIDGDNDGHGGDNGAFVLSRTGVNRSAVALSPSGGASVFRAIAALDFGPQGALDASQEAGSAPSILRSKRK